MHHQYCKCLVTSMNMNCSCSRKLLLRIAKRPFIVQRGFIIRPDTFWNNDVDNRTLEKHRRSRLNKDRESGKMPETPKDLISKELERMRFKYPEFLPRTDYPNNLTRAPMTYRDRILEMLERQDMYRRRDKLDIPEFYVGSIVAVTAADRHSPGKTNRFLGICIMKTHAGLYHKFTLRNVIDEQGVEIMYHMYNPTIQKIEVIVLEKRLDDELFYLRDAPLEYSTFPMDMEPTLLPKDSSIPINTMKVPLNPRPWSERWERANLKGIEDIEHTLTEKMKKKREHPQVQKPWEKHDLMLHYRNTINPVESAQIMTEYMRWTKRKRSQTVEKQS